LNSPLKDAASFERYSRQILFAGIGESGQQRLALSSAVIVGCGAIGASTVALLARAGVGRLCILDRDFVEPSNLQRQTLFDESDASNSLPKAIAAQQKLRTINSAVSIEGIVADVTPKNAEELLSGFDLILDGSDNFETRFLINDFAVKHNLPWIYAAAVGSYGVAMTIRPGLTACLACLLEGDRFPSGIEETCDTVGVLGPVVQLISSLESTEAIKLLAGKEEALHGRLISSDVWSGRFQSVQIARNVNCRACSHQEFSYLEGDAQPHVTMCGRDSVQIHERSRSLDLAALGARLSSAVEFVHQNDFLLRFRVSPYEMTVFADGRAILKGSQDATIARSLYARFIGS